MELLFGIGPALYFFTKSITDPDYRFSPKEYIHFIPVIIEFSYFRTLIYRMGFDIRMEKYINDLSAYQSTVDTYTIIYISQQWIAIISILLYMFFSVRLLLRHNIWIKRKYSNLKNKSLGWLRIPIYFYSGFWFIWLILRSIDTFTFQGKYKDFYFLPSIIGLALITCWIGFKGYMKSQSETAGFLKASLKSTPREFTSQESNKIIDLMTTRKPYLDPELDLGKLSELLNMNPKTTSYIINHYLNMNFYEFVNKYRIEEFKQQIQSKNRDKFTLLGHAFECGFNSKSTFNHIFKKSTGQTPREYYLNYKK